MSAIGNLLWIFLGGGIFIFLGYLIGGLVLCLTIVGIPFGVQLIKLSALGLAPFGRQVNTVGSASGLLPILMNVLWWIFGGVEVALVHLVFALLMAITVVGIPFAQQHMKLLQLSLVPFGAKVE
ncbi:MAG: YccF domain-containing protein [Chloroflexi bacterium]|nr:YccF domain-containing protein [Chloroflexota bacterium]